MANGCFFNFLLILVALQEEQEAIIKSKEKSGEEEVLSWADAKKMPITSRVIQETLRVASILSFTFREAVEDVEYEGRFQLSQISDKKLSLTYAYVFVSMLINLSPFFFSSLQGTSYQKGGKFCLFSETFITAQKFSQTLKNLTPRDLR